MAAGPPPAAAFGCEREFLNNPAQASAARIQGNLAAMNLQLLHVLRGVAHNDDQTLLDGIAEQNRLLMAASDASQVREQKTRELQPVAQVPGAN